MRSQGSLCKNYHQITKLHSSKTGHQKRFQLHTTRCSSAQMLDKFPDIFKLASLTNGSPTPMTNESLIWSDSGVQQGDSLDPLLFSHAIHDIVSSMKSNFNIWYFDDATIAGDPRSVCDEIKRCSFMLADIGLS